MIPEKHIVLYLHRLLDISNYLFPKMWFVDFRLNDAAMKDFVESERKIPEIIDATIKIRNFITGL
ncbi:hypothetical protein [Cytobacillus sp. AMY 15.2]|uniref:hypothetical protein n=1 Tax=Cytobacillus sp. AMY 15.2 TaxID=2939563 RepID=UPI00203C6AC8|nr:hypothetical protein [Cytobacillus sp. AMY 15.2]